jgi:hypothetical protein
VVFGEIEIGQISKVTQFFRKSSANLIALQVQNFQCGNFPQKSGDPIFQLVIGKSEV